MTIEGDFNLKPEGKRDMGNPSEFHFLEHEREEIKKREKMTDAQIDALEVAITNRQAEARLEAEKGEAA